MGRTGLSYNTFAKAAYDLLENNSTLTADDITIEKVRAVLNTGSNTTIGPYLKKWREQSNEASNDGEEKNSDAEMELVARLYRDLKAEAYARVAELEEKARNSVETAQQALAGTTKENESLKIVLDQTDQLLAQSISEKMDLEKLSDTLRKNCDDSDQKLGEKQHEIQRLVEINKSLSTNLERFHEASTSERQKLELKHEKELVELKNEITGLSDSKEKLQADLAEAKTDIGIWCTRAEEREKSISTLTERNKNLEEKNEK